LPLSDEVIPVALNTTAASITTPAPWRSFAISADFALSGAISVRPPNEQAQHQRASAAVGGQQRPSRWPNVPQY
jgi:hypothetical protein